MTEAEALRIQANWYAMTGELVRLEDILVAHPSPDAAPKDALQSLGPDE